MRVPKPDKNDPLPARNAEVKAFAWAGGFMTFSKEDHELAIRLNGRNPGRYPSDAPHAGKWGRDLWYIITPNPHGISNKLARELGRETGSPTRENLHFFNEREMVHVLIGGPSYFRAKRSRKRVAV